MTEKEALRILGKLVPRGSEDFEKLYRLYGVKCNKEDAILIFNRKWKYMDIEVLEIATKMFLKDLNPNWSKPSFHMFLHSELEEYIQAKQEHELGLTGVITQKDSKWLFNHELLKKQAIATGEIK